MFVIGVDPRVPIPLPRSTLANPDGFALDVAHLAHSIGLGGTGAHAPVQRTLRRLAVFGLARQGRDDPVLQLADGNMPDPVRAR